GVSANIESAPAPGRGGGCRSRKIARVGGRGRRQRHHADTRQQMSFQDTSFHGRAPKDRNRTDPAMAKYLPKLGAGRRELSATIDRNRGPMTVLQMADTGTRFGR